MRLPVSRRNLLFAVASFAIVLYAEWFYPARIISECKWPLGAAATNVALIADPQLVDRHMYPDRGWLPLFITKVVADRFMARNFRLLHSRLDPSAVFFMGDLFDGGREWGDTEWFAEYNRWERVFPLSRTVPHYQNVQGNHDVGSNDGIIPSARERFITKFGAPNQEIPIAGHTVVTLDTNALMDKKNAEIRQDTEAFLDSVSSHRERLGPIVLLTHVPLYRPATSYCGFEREGRPLQWTTGVQYITEVHPDISKDILTRLKPALVFSGDDHDACKYTHKYTTEDSAEENTVKSFSLATGISRPGFQLLSLGAHKRHETDLCLVGEPFWPIIFQGIAYALLILALAIVYAATRLRRGSGYSQLPRPAGIEKPPQNDRPATRASREFTQGLLASFGAWVFGQFVVHLWSYGSL